MCKNFLIWIGVIGLLFAGCGTDPSSESETGSISFVLDIQPPKNTKVFTAPVDCAVTGISNINVTVFNSSNTQVAFATFACSAHSGVVNNVPAGITLRVLVQGVDGGGSVIYTGERTGVIVQAGATTSIGSITLTQIGGNCVWDNSTWDSGCTWGP